MKLSLRFLITFLICSTTFAQSAEIDALIAPYVQTNNFSGQVWVAHDGKIIHSKAYGLMNRSYDLVNTRQTKFYLASVSLVFTSAAIMKLVEEKKLALDDRLSKFLPKYKHGGILTLHELLSQRSGIPAIGNSKKVDYDSITKFPHTCEKLISYVEDDDLLFLPNSKYNHGRSDYIVLACVIEKITGKPFGTYLKELIFDPLKMSNTGHSTGDTAIVSNLAAGYAAIGHYDVENAYQIDWTSKTGHGSIYSTAEDLGKFAEAILNDRLLTRDSWQRIFTDHGDQVGYGWFIRDHWEKKRVQMNGRSPGFSSYFGIYPDDKLTVVVLSNNYISLPPDLGRFIAALHFGKPYATNKLANVHFTPKQANRLVGNYKFDEKFYVPNFVMEVGVKDGDLSTSWGALIPVNEGKNQVRKFILRTYWSNIEFVENDKGEVVEMKYDDHRGVKVKN